MIKGVIYEITCKTTGDNYIGATTQTLEKRFSGHKRSINSTRNYPNCKLYNCMRKHGVENFTIEALFIRTVKKTHELREFEGKCVKDRQPTLNTLLTGLSYNDDGTWSKKLCSSKYYERNKEKIKEQVKQYREENKEVIAEKKRSYRERNKDGIVERKRVYYQENKERIKQKSKDNYEKNKDRLRERVTCECGDVTSRGSLNFHLKTDRHKNNLISQ